MHVVHAAWKSTSEEVKGNAHALLVSEARGADIAKQLPAVAHFNDQLHAVRCWLEAMHAMLRGKPA